MPLKNSESDFGGMARGLHWIVALLILMLLIMGFQMGTIPMGPDKFWVIGLHKSIGMTVLALGVIRLIWRTVSAPPASLPSHAKWEKFLAKTIHVVLYIGIIGMPLSGWVMSSAGEFSVSYFGLFDLPAIVPKNREIFQAAREVHELCAFGIIGAVGLHIAGALKHQIIDKDETMKRMGANIPVAALGLILLGLAIFIMAGGEEEAEAPVQASVAQVESGEMTGAVLAHSGAGWQIVKGARAVVFSFTQYGQKVEAGFTQWDADIIFNAEDLGASHAEVVFDVASIETGSADRDAQARGAEWFDAARFPKISFKSESFEHLEVNRYRARGLLNVRDVSKPINFDFTLDIETLENGKKKALMQGALKLKRLDFGVGQGQWAATDAIADDVEIGLSVEALSP